MIHVSLPLSFDELNEIDIEISVLTPLKKIKSIDEIQLGKHGIYIKKDCVAVHFYHK
jgi:AMMECR1 domain-containing protein